MTERDNFVIGTLIIVQLRNVLADDQFQKLTSILTTRGLSPIFDQQSNSGDGSYKLTILSESDFRTLKAVLFDPELVPLNKRQINRLDQLLRNIELTSGPTLHDLMSIPISKMPEIDILDYKSAVDQIEALTREELTIATWIEIQGVAINFTDNERCDELLDLINLRLEGSNDDLRRTSIHSAPDPKFFKIIRYYTYYKASRAYFDEFATKKELNWIKHFDIFACETTSNFDCFARSPYCNALEHLVIHDTSFTKEEFILLFDAPFMDQLIKLRLSGYSTYKVGTIEYLVSKRKLTKLRELSFQKLPITATEFDSVVNHYWSSLEILNLRACSNVNFNHIKQLLTFKNFPKLREIDFRGITLFSAELKWIKEKMESRKNIIIHLDH